MPLAALAALALLCSCSKTKVVELTVTPLAVNFEAAGGEQTVTISCNDAWTVTKTVDWITLSATSGEGNGTLTIKATANTSLDGRQDKVTVKAGSAEPRNITVGQLGLTASLSIGSFGIDAPAAGKTEDVPITSNVGWTVSIPADVDWITADPLSGTGSGKVTFTIKPNLELKARSANVTINTSIGGFTGDIPVQQVAAAPSRYTDSLALVAIYNAFGGAEKMKDGRKWDLTKPILDDEDPDNKWYGVTMENKRVTALKLLANTITAEWELPAEIGDLSELTDLRINTCKLKGTLPESVYGLSKLQYFYFQSNSLSGTLSEKVWELPDLTELYVNGNANLTGSFSSKMGSQKKLKKISVAETKFSGSIPAEISGCSALTVLYITHTEVSGSLPDIWDQLPVLEEVTIQNASGLTGAIPASLGKSTTIKKIQLDGCNLTGNIPESFGDLPSDCKLATFLLKGNKLSGVVPAKVQAHAKWQETTAWKYKANILPQQTGYGLTLN